MMDLEILTFLIFGIFYLTFILTCIVSWSIFMYSLIRLYILLIRTKGAWKKAHRWGILPTWNNFFFRLDKDFSDKKIVYYNNKSKKWGIIMLSSFVIALIFI